MQINMNRAAALENRPGAYLKHSSECNNCSLATSDKFTGVKVRADSNFRWLSEAATFNVNKTASAALL